VPVAPPGPHWRSNFQGGLFFTSEAYSTTFVSEIFWFNEVWGWPYWADLSNPGWKCKWMDTRMYGRTDGEKWMLKWLCIFHNFENRNIFRIMCSFKLIEITGRSLGSILIDFMLLKEKIIYDQLTLLWFFTKLFKLAEANPMIFIRINLKWHWNEKVSNM
jgi:hypothetical protein